MAIREVNSVSNASIEDAPVEYSGSAVGGLPNVTSNGENPVPLWMDEVDHGRRSTNIV